MTEYMIDETMNNNVKILSEPFDIPFADDGSLELDFNLKIKSHFKLPNVLIMPHMAHKNQYGYTCRRKHD